MHGQHSLGYQTLLDLSTSPSFTGLLPHGENSSFRLFGQILHSIAQPTLRQENSTKKKSRPIFDFSVNPSSYLSENHYGVWAFHAIFSLYPIADRFLVSTIHELDGRMMDITFGVRFPFPGLVKGGP